MESRPASYFERRAKNLGANKLGHDDKSSRKGELGSCEGEGTVSVEIRARVPGGSFSEELD